MFSGGSPKAIIGPIFVWVWAVVVIAGMAGMVKYQVTPQAVAATAPERWPQTTRIVRDTSRPTLVMMLHPQCPCSRASVHELAQLIALAQGHAAVMVVFVQPTGAPAHWTQTDLWRQASAIPGVSVAVDQDGRDALAFGAVISGQVDLYDAQGRRLFSGGITDGRGHEGDNPGLDAILALLRDERPQTSITPVYGCPLNGCRSAAVEGYKG
jgi:hypothetical protein